jgi:hypothetical protein
VPWHKFPGSRRTLPVREWRFAEGQVKRRFLAVFLAALFAAGAISVGATVSARTIQVPVRASTQAPHAGRAIAVSHKKKKHHKKKHHKKAKVANTANFDSCKVVTQAEAASAIGESVTPGVIGNATVEGDRACVFYGPSAPTLHTPNVAQSDTVRVVVVEGSDALTWYTNYKSKVKPQPITGYGDQAYYDGYASLSVLKGDYYLRIAVAPAGAPPSLSDEEQLATAASCRSCSLTQPRAPSSVALPPSLDVGVRQPCGRCGRLGAEVSVARDGKALAGRASP